MRAFVRRIMARGHKYREWRKAVQEIKYSDRAELLATLRDSPSTLADKKIERNSKFAAKFRGCIFTVRETVNMRKVESMIRPDLEQLQMTCTRNSQFVRYPFIAKSRAATLRSKWFRKAPK